MSIFHKSVFLLLACNFLVSCSSMLEKQRCIEQDHRMLSLEQVDEINSLSESTEVDSGCVDLVMHKMRERRCNRCSEHCDNFSRWQIGYDNIVQAINSCKTKK